MILCELILPVGEMITLKALSVKVCSYWPRVPRRWANLSYPPKEEKSIAHIDVVLSLWQLASTETTLNVVIKTSDRRQTKSVNYRTPGSYHLNLPKIEFTLFFLNVLTIAFKLLLLISEFLGVRMFRLVEQTCHRFKRRGKEWFLFGQLIGSWSAPFDGPKWHLCWRQKRLIDPCSDIVTLSATVVKCIFYETLYLWKAWNALIFL